MITAFVDIPQSSHRLIVAAICQYFDITEMQVFHSKRTNAIAYYKALVFYMIKEEMQLDNASIASIFNVSRQGVGSSVERIDREKRVYRQVNNDVTKIRIIYETLRAKQEEWLNSQSNEPI